MRNALALGRPHVKRVLMSVSYRGMEVGMTYAEAAEKLAEYLEVNYGYLDDDWYMVLDTAYEALVRIMEKALPPRTGTGE